MQANRATLGFKLASPGIAMQQQRAMPKTALQVIFMIKQLDDNSNPGGRELDFTDVAGGSSFWMEELIT